MDSIRALLNRIIDYAGLFPPAELDMASTVANYAAYLRSDDSWMLGRLIVPVSRLAEFEQHALSFLPRTDEGDIDIWQLSALASAAGTPQLQADIAAIEAFNLRHEEKAAGRAVIDVIEMRADSPAAIESTLDQIPDDYFAFFEIPIESDPRGLIANLVEGEAGAKVRTGGTTADHYPSPASLARFIAAAVAASVPFKATAGLHHPLRHFSPVVNAKEFGFLNVFIAGCLAQTEELPAAEIAELLEEESASAFKFDDQEIAWRNHRIKTEAIIDVREELVVSFGSCSFEEPLHDLHQLKLL